MDLSEVMKQLRMAVLDGMNECVLNSIKDEELLDIWLREGLPQGCTEEDLEWYAMDDECFTNITNAFAQIMTLSMRG